MLEPEFKYDKSIFDHQDYHDVKDKLEDELRTYVREAVTKLAFFKRDIMDDIQK